MKLGPPARQSFLQSWSTKRGRPQTRWAILKTNIDLFGADRDMALDIVAMSQLGAALVLLWPTISMEDRARLLETTLRISGIPTVPNATHRLLDLVERNKPSFQ